MTIHVNINSYITNSEQEILLHLKQKFPQQYYPLQKTYNSLMHQRPRLQLPEFNTPWTFINPISPPLIFVCFSFFTFSCFIP